MGWISLIDQTLTLGAGGAPIAPIAFSLLSSERLLIRASSLTAPSSWYLAFRLIIRQNADSSPTGEQPSLVELIRIPLNQQILVNCPQPAYTLTIEPPEWLLDLRVRMWRWEVERLPFTVSQSSLQATYTATYANLNDDNRLTGGSTASQTTGTIAWIEADLGQLRQVDRVMIGAGVISGVFNAAPRLNGASLEVSRDRVVWSAIAHIANMVDSGDFQRRWFSVGASTRYLRVARDGIATVCEFQIWG